MKRFLLRSGCFILLLAALFGALELGLRSIPNDYAYKNHYLEEHASSLEVLSLGSSHSYYGIDPAYFDRPSFNASHVSQSLFYDLGILDKFKDDMTQLKYILLPISSFTLSHRIEDGTEAWRVRSYHLYYDLAVPQGITPLYEVTGNDGFTNFKRVADYLRTGQGVNCDERGFLARPPEDPQDLEATGIRAAKRHNAMNPVHQTENRHILDALLQDARSIGARVILYTPPGHDEYVGRLDPAAVRQMKELAETLDRSSQVVIYLNFLEDPRFADSDFYDADHVNAAGARKLTGLINQAMQEWDRGQDPVTAAAGGK
ncbi:hypothetical protein NQU17_05105 [Clostridiaceae bacterium HFYG-1003]|nr:hypothetical protein NQU17_05105 [Clostridiaceae bacterium HFYG-1003]